MRFFRQIRSILGKTEVGAQAEQETFVDSQSQPVERRTRIRLDTHKGRRVLIVDDSATIVAALRKMLRSAGCLTLEALNAENGLELVRREKPDLVFLDIVLPGMNGFAALRLMRKDPLTQHIPVIMISGNEQATEQFYAKRIGADDFMKKPFSRHEVFARIESLIEGKKLPIIKASNLPESPPVAPATQTATHSTIVPERTANTPAQSTSHQQPLKPVISTPTDPTPPSSLEARVQLTAMGLQYFNQDQFHAAIKRWDKLALEFFIIGGGVNVNVDIGGKTLLEVAKARGQENIVALLRR